MPAQQGHWIATAYLETGTITRGYVACLNEAGTRYIVASAANRTAAGRRSACIALENGDADNPSGSGFESQYVGAVPPSITGLGAGDASLIRVSSTGALERVATYDGADDVCGRCDEDGTAYVCFPLVGMSLALGSGGGPAGNTNSLQYKVDSSTFGGANNVAINQAAARSGGYSTTGDQAFTRLSSVGARNNAGDADLCVWTHAASGSVDYLNIGGLGGDPTNASQRTFTETSLFGRTFAGAAAGFASGRYAAGYGAVAPGATNWTGSAATARLGFVHPNLYLGPLLVAPSADPFNGGLGYAFIEDVATVRGGALRTTGFGLWSRVADHHPMVTIGSTDHDLLASELINVTSTTPGDIAISAGITHAVVNCNASGLMVIPGFTAPAAGQPRFIFLTNNSSDNVSIPHDDGDTAINGVYHASSYNLIAAQYQGAVLAYDHNADRYIPLIGAELVGS